MEVSIEPQTSSSESQGREPPPQHPTNDWDGVRRSRTEGKKCYVKLFTKLSCERRRKTFKTPTNFNFNSNRNFSSSASSPPSSTLFWYNISDMMMMVSCYSSGDSVDVVGSPFACRCLLLLAFIDSHQRLEVESSTAQSVWCQCQQCLCHWDGGEKISVRRQNESAQISTRVFECFSELFNVVDSAVGRWRAFKPKLYLFFLRVSFVSFDIF